MCLVISRPTCNLFNRGTKCKEELEASRFIQKARSMIRVWQLEVNSEVKNVKENFLTIKGKETMTSVKLFRSHGQDQWQLSI